MLLMIFAMKFVEMVSGLLMSVMMEIQMMVMAVQETVRFRRTMFVEVALPHQWINALFSSLLPSILLKLGKFVIQQGS